MTEQEYNQMQSDDAIVKAIEDVSTLLTSMSGTDAAIAASIGSLADDVAILDDDLVALRTSVDTHFSTIGDIMLETGIGIADIKGILGNMSNTLLDIYVGIDDRMLEMQRSSESLLSTMSNSLNMIQTSTSDLTDNIVDSTFRKDDANFLTASLNLMQFIVNDKNAKAFRNNAKGFADGVDLLLVPVNKLLNAYDSIDNAADAMDNIGVLFDSMGKAVAKSGKAVVLIVGSTIAMAAAISMLDWATIGKFIVTFPVLCATLALGVAIIGKTTDKQNMQSISNFALGIGILSVALMAFAYLDWATIAKGVVGITGLSVGLALAMKLWPDKAIGDFSKSVFKFAAGVGILAIATAAISMIVAVTPWDALLKGMGVMLVAGGVLALASIAFRKGASDIGKSFAWLALGLAAFGLSLTLFQDMLVCIHWETWAIAGGAIVALAGSVWLLGQNKVTWTGIAALGALVGSLFLVTEVAKQMQMVSWESLGKVGAALLGLAGTAWAIGSVPMTWTGVAGLAAIAGATWVFAKALQEWPSLDWESLGKIGAALAGLGLIFAGAGTLAIPIAAGAAAIGLAGGAIWAFGAGLKKYPTGIAYDTYETIAKGAGIVAGAVALIGNPLTLIPLMAGLAVTAGLGGALYSLGKGLKQAEQVDMTKASTSATAIVKWAKDTLSIIAGAGIAKMAKAGFNLGPFQKLGTSLAALAMAVNLMANGTYNEYGPIDPETGKPTIIATHNIGPEQYAAFGDAVAQLTNAITEPLQKFGAGGGFLRSSDAEKGMEAMSHIGDIVNPMIEIANAGDKIKDADYSGFGVAVDNLIKGVSEPLEKVGKGSAWYKSNDFEKGANVVAALDDTIKPIVEISQHWSTIKDVDFGKVGDGLTAFVTNVGTKLVSAGKQYDEYDSGTRALMLFDRIVKPMNSMLNVAKSYAEFNEDQRTAMSETLTAISGSIVAYKDADATLPATSRIANHMQLFTRAINRIDNKNLELIVDSAHAIESIANADLNNISKAKSELSKQLFDLLGQIKAELKTISNNTAPDEIDRNVIRIDPKTGRPDQEFRYEDGMEINLTTISLQLDQLYGLLAAQRT